MYYYMTNEAKNDLSKLGINSIEELADLFKELYLSISRDIDKFGAQDKLDILTKDNIYDINFEAVCAKGTCKAMSSADYNLLKLTFRDFAWYFKLKPEFRQEIHDRLMYMLSIVKEINQRYYMIILYRFYGKCTAADAGIRLGIRVDNGQFYKIEKQALQTLGHRGISKYLKYGVSMYDVLEYDDAELWGDPQFLLSVLSKRTANALNAYHIFTLNDIKNYIDTSSREALIEIRNIGILSRAEILGVYDRMLKGNYYSDILNYKGSTTNSQKSIQNVADKVKEVERDIGKVVELVGRSE